MDRSLLRYLWLRPDILHKCYETRLVSFPGGFCSLPFTPKADERENDAGDGNKRGKAVYDVNEHAVPFSCDALPFSKRKTRQHRAGGFGVLKRLGLLYCEPRDPQRKELYGEKLRFPEVRSKHTARQE